MQTGVAIVELNALGKTTPCSLVVGRGHNTGVALLALPVLELMLELGGDDRGGGAPFRTRRVVEGI